MFKKENLRKNFLRVKQNIDQNLGRSEKSEVLSEDQQENEKRVDVVKHAFQNIAKKSGAVLQAQGSDPDKRLRKLPETGLGHALQESAHGLGIESLLGHTCNVCGDCQGNLAKERVQFESVMEQEFIKPLNNIVDVDIPSIIKQRKVLNKSILDMDSAKSRFHQAVRQSSVPGANMSNAATKVDGIREELDEAESKVETNKDNLSIELCNFTAKESEHAYLLLGLLEAQANYHRRAIETIEACIPQLRLAIQNSPAKPCYGLHLEEHLRLTGRDIAVVLEACVLTLFEIGLEEEGLFRVAGSANKVKKLKASFDAFPFDANALDVMVQDYGTDPFAVAGALKQYLRELPEPLLTFALHDDFMHAATLPPEQRLTTLWTIINRLPLANYNNFRYLIKFLAKLKDKSDVNKMKASNIAIVVGPNLLWSEGTDTPSMITTGTLSTVIEAVVTHADYFYPGELNFNVSGYDEDHEHFGPNPIMNTSHEAPTIQVPSPGPYSPQPVSPKSSSPASLSVNISSDGSEATSPVQRRVSRKPAPPPPPERPFNVMVTATTNVASAPSKASSDGNSNNSSSSNSHNYSSASDDSSSLSWPQPAPLASPESPTDMPTGVPGGATTPTSGNTLERHQQHRISGGGGSGGYVDRPSMPPPERPKLPPPVTIPPPGGKGHQRSASTGAVMNTDLEGGSSSATKAGIVPASPSSAGDGLTPNDLLAPHSNTLSSPTSLVAPGMSSTLGRSVSLRPRPSPPPPPPPIAKESEDTKM